MAIPTGIWIISSIDVLRLILIIEGRRMEDYRNSKNVMEI